MLTIVRRALERAHTSLPCLVHACQIADRACTQAPSQSLHITVDTTMAAAVAEPTIANGITNKKEVGCP